MERNELPLEPRNIGVPSGGSKTISEPMVPLVQAVHRACSDPNGISECTKMITEPRHLRVPSGVSKMITEPVVHLAQTVHLS
jgi:hypothetical protein